MLCRVGLEKNVSLCLFDRRLAEVSPVLRHRVLACCQPARPCLHSCHGGGLYQVSSAMLVAPTTLQRSLQMHIRHTADRFRLIAHIEKESTASSSCSLAHVQQEVLLLLNVVIVPPNEYAYVPHLKPYNRDPNAIVILGGTVVCCFIRT